MSFNATIQSIRDGALLELLTGKLNEVVEAVPEQIKLRIPLFYGEEPLDVVLLFRYRMKEGGLQLGYEFHRLKPVLDAAFRSAAVRVAEASGLPAHFGSAL